MTSWDCIVGGWIAWLVVVISCIGLWVFQVETTPWWIALGVWAVSFVVSLGLFLASTVRPLR